MSGQPPRLGAYGLHLPDLAAANGLLIDAPDDWPSWGVDVEVLSPEEVASGTPALDKISAKEATCKLAGAGWMVADRPTARTTLFLPHRPDAAKIVHPFFSLSAAVAAFWNGDTSAHAAAVIGADGAWGLLGTKGSGKSSTIAAWAEAGYGVLTDDVLVIRDGAGLAGPRCIDLRPDAVPEHGDAEPLGFVGARDRWRLQSAPVPAEIPFRGWFVLGWGEQVALKEIPEDRRIPTVFGNLSLRVPPLNPRPLASLAALPMRELSRPRERASIPATIDTLARAIGL